MYIFKTFDKFSRVLLLKSSTVWHSRMQTHLPTPLPARVAPSTGHSSPARGEISFYAGQQSTANRPQDRRSCSQRLNRAFTVCSFRLNVQNLVFTLFNLILFDLVHCLCFLRSSWVLILPCNIFNITFSSSSGNLMGMCSIFSSNVFIKTCDKGPKMEPWGLSLPPGWWWPINWHLSVTVTQTAVNVPNWLIVQCTWLYQYGYHRRPCPMPWSS